MSSTLSFPQTDEQEWARLASEQPTTFEGKWVREQDVAPKFSDRPHPRSYGADLPMRTTWQHGHPKIAPLTAAEKKAIALRAGAKPAAAKTVVRPNAPHPDSYRPDLPLRGLGLASYNSSRGRATAKWTLTAEEKALLADRPLRYTRSASLITAEAA